MPRNPSTLTPSPSPSGVRNRYAELPQDDVSLPAIDTALEDEVEPAHSSATQNMTTNRVSFQQLSEAPNGTQHDEQDLSIARQDSYGSICPPKMQSPRTTLRRSSTRASAVQRMSAKIATQLFNRGAAPIERKGTVASVSVNTLCNIIGAGVLSLPLAMKHASIGIGLFLMLFCSAVSCFAAYCVTVACEMTKRESFSETLAFAWFPPLTFSEYLRMRGLASGNMPSDNQFREEHREHERRMGKYRKIVMICIEAVIFLLNFGTLIVYTKIVSTCIPPVIASFLGGSGLWVSDTTWLLIAGVVFFILSCVRTMNELLLSSIVGVVTIMYIVICVVVRYVHPIGLPTGESPELQQEVEWFQLGTEVFQTLSSYGVAFGYHYNIPYFYRELRNQSPKQLMKTVAVAFPVVTASYATCGVLGYLTFGALVASRRAGGDIVQNYRDDDTLINVGRLGLFFHFASVFPILSVSARRGIHRIMMNVLVAISSQTVDEDDNPVLPGTLDETDDESASADGAHDVGSAEDTTRLAIVVEALIIVALIVFLAGVVDGITPVIDIVGVLFGLFLIFIAPALMGIRAFSSSSHGRYFDAERSFHSTLWYRTAVAMLIIGILFTVVGFVFVCINLGSS